MKKFDISLKKLFIIISSFALVFIVINIAVVYFSPLISPKEIVMKNAHKNVHEKERIIKKLLTTSETTLLTLRESSSFNYFLNNSGSKEDIQNLFLFLSKINPSFMQLRYVDENGLEQIKIKRNSENLVPFIVSKEKLQDKSNYYYFKESKSKKSEKVWFSALDLNVENNKIETPYQATIRAILPIQYDEKFRGILIINYFMNSFIENLLKIPLYNSILMNNRGEYLVHFEKEKSWSKYDSSKIDIFSDYPNFYSKILDPKEHMVVTNDFIVEKLELPVKDGLILLLQMDNESSAQQDKSKYKHYLMIMLSSLFITLILTFILIKYYKNFFLNIVSLQNENSTLRKSIIEKNKILKEKNNQLTTALQKAQESNIAKSVFLSNISHEVRTPLNAIIGFSELMSNSKEIGDKYRKMTSVVLQSSKSLLTTLTDMLNMAKIISEDFEIECSSVDINSLSKKIIENYTEKANKKNVKLILNLSDNIPGIKSDSKLLEQAISQLICNGIKFSKEGGIVNLSVSLEKDNEKKTLIRFIVEDNGIGISPDRLETIFQSFSQADNRVSRDYDGSGLGLTIASKIIEKLGSKIYVSSKIDEGSKFWFDIQFKKYEE